MTEDIQIHPEPKMDSAGAELMALSFRLDKHPEFEQDAQRVREIAAWISVGRIGDMEMSLIKMIGRLVGTMKSRNLAFDEGLPMEPQLLAFLEGLPDPLPGQPGYVDQTLLSPIDRRDTFEAEVQIGEDVRSWTASDGIVRSVAHECSIQPVSGIPGIALVCADGPATAKLVPNTVVRLNLRCTGGALCVQD